MQSRLHVYLQVSQDDISEAREVQGDDEERISPRSVVGGVRKKTGETHAVRRVITEAVFG